MKKTILTLACALICALAAYSQGDTAGYKVEGTTIIVTKSRTAIDGKASTGLTYQDRDGNRYPVYQSKGGKYYVLKESKNTGKEYKYYLPAKLQKAFGELQKNINHK